MNTCRLCGDPVTPPHDLCGDCGYDITNEINDWGLYPVGLDI